MSERKAQIFTRSRYPQGTAMLTPYLGIRSIYDNNSQIHKFCFHIIRIDYNKITISLWYSIVLRLLNLIDRNSFMVLIYWSFFAFGEMEALTNQLTVARM